MLKIWRNIVNRNKSIADRVESVDYEVQLKKSLRELFPEYTGEVVPEVAARIYNASPYVNACTNMIAGYLCTVPLKVYSRSGSNSPKRELKSGYPYKLIRYVNSYQTQIDFLRSVISWLVLTDNAFISIEPTIDADTGISALSMFCLNPTNIRVVPDPDTHAKAYVYLGKNGERIYIPADRMIHISGFNPLGHWYGHSNLNALSADIRLERFAKNKTSKFYADAITISGVLSTESKMHEDEVRKIKRELEEQYAGGKNAYRLMVLTDGMEYKPFEGSKIEFDSIPVIDSTAATHAMVMGVPFALLTGQDQANILDYETIFWNRTLIPLGAQIESMLTKKLAWPVSQNISIEFDYRNVEALRIQALNRARVDVAYLMAGKNTPNEIREQHNEEPFDGEASEFGETPVPLWQFKYGIRNAKPGGPGQTGASPSASLPGSGRDQSDTGEAQMVDGTGSKDLDTLLIEQLEKFFEI